MASRRRLWAIVLGAIPWIAYVIVSLFFNRPGPLRAGMPPLMFWATLWTALTSLCLHRVYGMGCEGGWLWPGLRH
ncbi:MAG: hypothetical protein ABWW69_07175 [Pyrodictiaceae archaeon]